MASANAKLERLTDLILALLDAPAPVPLSRIATEVPGYPEGHEARRQAFERDKRLLREEGIIVDAIPIGGEEQFGYRIEPTTFFLPDLGLEADEQAALNLAVAAVHIGDDSGGDALRKLGMSELAEVQPVAALAVTSGLDRLFRAIASTAEVRFTYRGETRVVCPVRLRFAGGHWYLAGWSREREAGRNFRVDRIEGVVSIGVAGSGAVEGDPVISLELPEEPWGDGEAASTLTVSVDALYAWKVIGVVGEAAVVEQRDDGSIVIEVGVARDDAARSWLLSFLDHVEVLEPVDAREGLISWLDGIVQAPARSGEPPSLDALLQSTGTASAASSTGSQMQDRLRRLLAMLEWLASVGSAPTTQVAERFGMSVDEVIDELELAACCGRPPYSPDELMDIIVDREQVTARLPEMQGRRQLTASEGVVVAAAATTILSMPGADPDGPLSRALGKLRAALGERPAIQVDIPDPPLLLEIQAAAVQRRQLEVEYLASSTDEMTSRLIDPLRVAAIDGRWYADAFCHRAGERRTFRVDSFKSVTDVGPQPPGIELPDKEPEAFTPTADAEVAIVTVDSSAAWVADSIPVLARRAEPDGTVTVAVSVSARTWFERILLQAGPGAQVSAPPSMVGLAASAAGRVLRRYRPTV